MVSRSLHPSRKRVIGFRGTDQGAVQRVDIQMERRPAQFIAQRFAELAFAHSGYAAAELLDRLMVGHEPPVEPIRVIPRGLVIRESTDFFAVDNSVVAAALAFIASHSQRRIGPDDAARAVGAETRTLQNYFQNSLKRPIAAEVRRVRIERAKRELAQGNRALAAIAGDVGFGTIQRLYEVFRREIGMSPGEYRRQRKLSGAG